MFLVDASGSVHSNNFRKQLDFITEFADHMPIHPDKVRIGVVLFATHKIPQFNMNEYHDRSSFKQAVRRIQYPLKRRNKYGWWAEVYQNEKLYNGRRSPG